MTRKERLMRTLRGESVDRPAVSFYEIDGVRQDEHDLDPFNIFNDPSWGPLLQLAREKTDQIVMCAPVCRHDDGSPAALLPPQIVGTETSFANGRRRTVTRVQAGRRTLTQCQVRDADVDTVWTTEHLLKDAADLASWVSLPDAPDTYAIDVSGVLDIEDRLGDAGIVMLNVADPLCCICKLMDMASYTLTAFTEPELFRQALDKALRHVLRKVERISTALPGRLWRIVGPEYASAPYLPPHLFKQFVTDYDRRLVDLIHRSGGYARLHSHGNLKGILGHIVDTGCMGLDPVEPAPQGDVTLAYVRKEYGRDLVLFGNLEASDIETLAPGDFRKKVLSALEEGTAGEGRGFVLMPSACPYGRTLSATAMTNYETMIDCIERF